MSLQTTVVQLHQGCLMWSYLLCAEELSMQVTVVRSTGLLQDLLLSIAGSVPKWYKNANMSTDYFLTKWLSVVGTNIDAGASSKHGNVNGDDCLTKQC